MIEWKPIKGYNGKYLVNENGDIKSCHFKIPRLIKTTHRDHGYLRVKLRRNGRSENKSVHRIVAETFIKKPDKNNLQVNHIDGDKYNNHVTNLEWCTSKDNINHAFENGLNTINNRIILTNLKTNEQHKFISQRKASDFLSQKQNYICRMLTKDIFVVKNKEGTSFEVEREK